MPRKSEDKPVCGVSFSVITWRHPDKPWRTNTVQCTCSLDSGHGGTHAQVIGSEIYEEGVDYPNR